MTSTTADGRSLPSRSSWPRSLRQASLAFFITRFVLLIAGVMALRGPAFEFARDPANLAAHRTPAVAPIEIWIRWDAEWYLDIAQRGYAAALPADVFDMRPNFFPALPVAIRLFTPAAGNSMLAGVLVCNTAFLIGLSLLHQWTARRVSPSSADRLVWIYTAFPTSFFFSAVYAEALLLLMLAAAWWAADQKRWLVSGVCLAVAVLTRPTGLFGAVALAWKGVREVWTGPTTVARMSPLLVLPAAAGVGYVLFAHYVFGDALATVHTQAVTRVPLTWPWATLVNAWQNGLYWNDYYYSLIDGVIAVGAVLGLPFVFWRLGATEGILATGLVLFPLTSGLVSFSRLVLPVFPLFAIVADEARTWRFPVLVGMGLALQIFLFVWFVRWGWVA